MMSYVLDRSVREQSCFLHHNKHRTSRSNLFYTRRTVAFFDRRVSWRSFSLEKSRDAKSGGAVDPHLLPIKMSAAITSLTLTEEDLLLLIKSEVLDAKLKDLPSLQSHLDSCRADRVRARIVDCSGCLVYKTDMVYSALSGVPSVGRLRSELTAHFEQVEASYREEVQAAIKLVDEDHLLKTDGNRLGTVFRGPIVYPGPGGVRWLSDDITQFVLDGVAFHSRSLSCGPVAGGFYVGRFLPYGRHPAVCFQLRKANWDPSLGDDGRPRDVDGGRCGYFFQHHFRPARLRGHKILPKDHPQSFSAFSQYVMGAVGDDSLELVLAPELFDDSARGAPYMATFSSLEVKKRFVEFVEILELARKMYIEEPEPHIPENIGSIVTRIMHKPEILRRLEEPHRTNFDNIDWWYLTRNLSRNYAFSLMAAESADESQNKVLSDDHTSLVDLIGAPEVLPDEDGEDERLIQLRITTRKAGH